MAFLFKLKLLNGPLIGRELALPVGALTLGQGDVDLQLPLEGIYSTSVVSLQVTEQGVFLQSEVDCWIEGKLWYEHEQPLPLEQVIDIAGQGLLLGLPDGTLTQRPLPKRQTSADPLTAMASAHAAKAPSKHSWLTASFSLGSSSWIRPVSSALLGLMVLLGSGGWLLSAIAVGQSAHTQEELTPWIDQQLKQPELAGLQSVWQPDGSLHFTGHCRDSRPLNALVIQLRRYGVLLREPAVCQDQLLNNVRYVLHLFGYERFTVTETDTPGIVAIRGAIQADDRWRQVVDMLSVMPGLKQWSVENHSDRQLKSLLAQLLKAGLLKRLSISRSGERLLVSGRLRPAQQKQLNQQLALFSQRWNPAPVVIYQNIRASQENQELFPAAIISVGGSEKYPFLELADGMRLQVGARLPNGYQIAAIDGLHGVELTREGQLVHVPLEL
ncbi:MAG: type III secretion system inner membrane ring subunit SctD [Candidatus Symbiodolus clandestinus]